MIGALELSEPGTKGVFPHEQTTPKAHSDRLQMLRSCRANLSAVWGLSLTPGLGALCELPGPPDARVGPTTTACITASIGCASPV